MHFNNFPTEVGICPACVLFYLISKARKLSRHLQWHSSTSLPRPRHSADHCRVVPKTTLASAALNQPSICQYQIQWKKFGVGLNFTPVVLSEGRISLKVMTEVSELSNENSITPRSSSSNAAGRSTLVASLSGTTWS